MYIVSIVRSVLLAGIFLVAVPAASQTVLPFADARLTESGFGFEETLKRLQAAVGANGMLLLSTASASQGAANAGYKIPGNAILFVFRNDFARRLLAENVSAGFEAPLRIYVTERADGRGSIAWRRPSGLFSAYGSVSATSIGTELDAIFEKIVADALR